MKHHLLNMERPVVGETITSGIDDITDKGHGRIRFHDGFVNVGPVTEDALGVEATATLTDHNRAELHTDVLQPPVGNLAAREDSFHASIRPRNGKVFDTTIDEVNNEGHGIINTRGGFINLGPVTEDAEGEYIKALKLPGAAARLKSKKVMPENYISELEKLFDYEFSLDFGDAGAELGKRPHTAERKYYMGRYASISELQSERKTPTLYWEELKEEDTFTAVISRISNSGNGLIETVNGEINIGPVVDDAARKSVEATILQGTFAECLSENLRADDYQEWLSGKVDDRHLASSIESSPDSDVVDSKDKNQETKTEQTDIDAEDTGPDGATAAEIKELRDKAQQEAVSSVPTSAVTSKTTKQEYSRSSAIREYVLARADGECEGCSQAAPFTSKTGDPYLHAHHIHELSDGGSDTVDTVVALCPNCHYRVHHGEDGEQFNEELLETVQTLENE